MVTFIDPADLGVNLLVAIITIPNPIKLGGMWTVADLVADMDALIYTETEARLRGTRHASLALYVCYENFCAVMLACGLISMQSMPLPHVTYIPYEAEEPLYGLRMLLLRQY